MGTTKELTILGHIYELRNRLLKGVIAVVVTSVLSFIFADRIFHFLTQPIQGYPLVYIEMTEMFGVYMKVCLTAGVAAAMPYLVYQFFMFVAPALTPNEKRNVYFILPWIAFMFLGGVAFGYFVLLTPATNFLFSFGSNIATPQIRISSYIDVVTRLMLAAGIIFELPVITSFLTRLGIISSQWLAGKRKFAFILAFIIGAIITPTSDPVNQILVAGPLIVLYEMSIWLAKLFQPKQAKTELAEPNPVP